MKYGAFLIIFIYELSIFEHMQSLNCFPFAPDFKKKTHNSFSYVPPFREKSCNEHLQVTQNYNVLYLAQYWRLGGNLKKKNFQRFGILKPVNKICGADKILNGTMQLKLNSI